jgi:hypothetical protein
LILCRTQIRLKAESYKADLGASAVTARYDQYSGEDYEDCGYGPGQIGAARAAGLTPKPSKHTWQVVHSPDDVIDSDLTKYRRTSMYLAYTHSPGSLFTRIGGHVVTLHYDNTDTPTGTVSTRNDCDEPRTTLACASVIRSRPTTSRTPRSAHQSDFQDKVDDNGFERAWW